MRMAQSLRSLLKSPGFTAIAVVTLALGIGASTAIFSVVNGVLLRPLPYPNADRVIEVWTRTTGNEHGAHAAADFLELQRSNRSLAVVAGYREDAITISSSAAEPVRVTGALVTVDYFDVFGTPAAMGRTFNRGTDASTT